MKSAGKRPVPERIWIMKRWIDTLAPALAFGAAGFALRLLQNRTGFEPDTGLPIPGNVPAIILPVLLAAAAVVLWLLSRRLGKAAAEQPFGALFSMDDRGGLCAVLAGGCIMAISGAAELMGTAGGGSMVLSADGMEFAAAPAGGSGSLLFAGVMSFLAGVCLVSAVFACRKSDSAPLALLAVPVCLLARLIPVYRRLSVNPVLADYYPEILGLMFLILGAYRLSGFAVQAGRPRVFSLYTGMTMVLALTLLADGVTPAALLMPGGALALAGFRMMLRTAPAE